MRFEGRAYRAHDPRWAFSPLSGQGAAVHGGRFNPVNVPALYLGLSAIGALNELCQGFAGRIAPTTLCEYDIDCDNIYDLTDASLCAGHGISESDMSCNWFEDYKILGKTPTPWSLAASLIERGAAGIIVRSDAPDATPDHKNLVLWTWSSKRPHRVRVFDPTGKLPKNQLSWK